MSQAKSVMRAAYVNGRIERDPTVGIKMPKVRTGDREERVNPEDVPTRAEVLAILDGAPEHASGLPWPWESLACALGKSWQ